MNRLMRLALLALTFPSISAAQYPAPDQHDFILKDFKFRSGGSLPELRIHYRTLGKPERGAAGAVRNAVLIMHGTGGSGAQFIRSDFAGALFAPGALKSADANDVLYQIEASSDYDPGPDLEQIRAPLLAINSADDLINPPELGILEREITRVAKGRAVIIPLSPETRGHGTHTIAAVWKSYLEELLKLSAR